MAPPFFPLMARVPSKAGRAIDISGEDGFTISFDDLKIKDAGSVSGSVNIIPSIDVDFDWEFPATIKRARAVVNLDTTGERHSRL